MVLKDILKEFYSDSELSLLEEAIQFSLPKEYKNENLAKYSGMANYYKAKLITFNSKLKFIITELETEFDYWYVNEYHEITLDYDGVPELLKTVKDYEREMRRKEKYKTLNNKIKQLKNAQSTIEEKIKDLSSIDWTIKNIIESIKLNMLEV